MARTLVDQKEDPYEDNSDLLSDLPTSSRCVLSSHGAEPVEEGCREDEAEGEQGNLSIAADLLARLIEVIDVAIGAVSLLEWTARVLHDQDQQGCDYEAEDSLPSHEIKRLLAMCATKLMQDVLLDDHLERVKELTNDHADVAQD